MTTFHVPIYPMHMDIFYAVSLGDFNPSVFLVPAIIYCSAIIIHKLEYYYFIFLVLVDYYYFN